jgi:uncharacterized membrane-anchored protein YhcB (DUF1043 family)
VNLVTKPLRSYVKLSGQAFFPCHRSLPARNKMTWDDIFESIRSSWEWVISSDLPQGWAILIGLVVGLSAIAWQTNRGFRSLIKNQQSQAELDRQRLQLSQQRRRAEIDGRGADAKALAAALTGELTACHQMLSPRATDTKVMQAASNKIISDGDDVGEPLTSPAITTPVYQSTIPQLGLLGASLAGDVVNAYSQLNMKTRNDNLPKSELRNIARVITRLQAFREGSQDLGLELPRVEEANNSAEVSSEKTVLVTRQDSSDLASL